MSFETLVVESERSCDELVAHAKVMIIPFCALMMAASPTSSCLRAMATNSDVVRVMDIEIGKCAEVTILTTVMAAVGDALGPMVRILAWQSQGAQAAPV